jgi:hypothetical protein
LIWIDCLCINQNETKEKSHQVRILHKIYSQAHVVSWLGTGRDIDLQCVSFYIPLLAHFWTTPLRGDPKRRWRETSSLGIIALEKHLVAQATLPRPQYSADTLVSIFNTGYFERVWTIQEIVLGKTNTCQIGDAIFSLAVLAAAVGMLEGSNSCSTNNPSPILEFESTDFEFEKLQGVLYYYLEPALHKHWTQEFFSDSMRDPNVVLDSRNRQCMDQRDHIYGLTSLFETPDEYNVDYTLSLNEVIAESTVHCMLNGQGIDVLNSNCPHTERIETLSPGALDLPSWCPNWTASVFGDHVRFTHEQSKIYCWEASVRHELVHLRPSKLALTLRGLAVTRIKLCSGSLGQWWMSDNSGWTTWLSGDESLCNFLRSLGVPIDHSAKGLILWIFDHFLIPAHAEELVNSRRSELSPELLAWLAHVDAKDQILDLLAPVYLAKMDPELFKAAGFEVSTRVSPDEYAEIESRVSQELFEQCSGTRLVATDNKLLGLGYSAVREGDLVCILYGSRMPYILRPVDNGEHFLFVGACDIDGLMHGEGLEMGLDERDFTLV